MPPVAQDPRFMYLSLDEACTHVDAAAFRLVAGIYNRQGTRLLATSVSQPIRVLANNDMPTGAARILLDAQLPADWEGWAAEADAPAVPKLATPPRKANGPATRRRAAVSRKGGKGSLRASLLLALLPAHLTATLPALLTCLPTASLLAGQAAFRWPRDLARALRRQRPLRRPRHPRHQGWPAACRPLQPRPRG
jgi:hypothetical protein